MSERYFSEDVYCNPVPPDSVARPFQDISDRDVAELHVFMSSSKKPSDLIFF